jgi:hypothetical protein
MPTYMGYVKPNPNPHASVGTDLSCANELLTKSKIALIERIVNIFFIKEPSLFVDDIVISAKQFLIKINKLFLVLVKILQ